MPNIEPPVPALVPVADWSRVRILLDGEPLLAREGEVLSAPASSTCAAACCCRPGRIAPPPASPSTGRELRLLSLADRAAGLQLLQFSLDRDGVDVRLEASFAMAGLGMEPVRLEQDLGAWRTEGTRKGVAMTGAATLRLGDEVLAPDRPFSAALGLALALRGRAGGRIRPPRRGGTGRYAGGRSRPARQRRAGAQPCAGLARRAGRARGCLGCALDSPATY